MRLAEFHVYDQETEPETQLRQQIVSQINTRRGCFATLTSKRALENYLHPRAIAEAGGPTITDTYDKCVADLVARRQFESRPGLSNWSGLTRRTQRRLAQRAKRWLHRWATPRMTPGLLEERDPEGKVRGWLRDIGHRLW